MMHRRWLAAALLSALGCTESATPASPPSASPAPEPSQESALAASESATPARPQIDGRAFPDRVIALTWDDGPDKDTLPLAQYLEGEHISGTFFVVDEWIAGLSSDPGEYKHALGTGYKSIPILHALVEAHQRLGNHTLNHVLLPGAGAAMIDYQLRKNQEGIEPFVTNELFMFRAPGGAWDAATARTVDADPILQGLVGPIRWDVDEKDWEDSWSCESTRPAVECERAEGGTTRRVKPKVTAARYVSAIDALGHGIVLLHDRVDDVGARYSLDVAEAIVPQLKARGFVFAAPVLEFSTPTTRLVGLAWDRLASIALADLNGDGRSDLCVPTSRGIACAVSAEVAADGVPRMVFTPQKITERAAQAAAEVLFGDVDGDGHADACTRAPHGLSCAHGLGAGAFGPWHAWPVRLPDTEEQEALAAVPNDDDESRAPWLADIDGDHLADVCEASPLGVFCAKSFGHGFDRARLWLSIKGASFEPGDVNGDGRADLCVRDGDGIVCALSTGKSFGRPERWSARGDFADEESFRLGDLNGDGRADVCASDANGISCAFSTGRAFTRSSRWQSGRSARSFELADVNGDGRADVCFLRAGDVVCGIAP